MAYQLVTYCHRRHNLSCRIPVALGLIVLTLGLVSCYPQEYGRFPDNVPGSSSFLAPPPGAKVDRQTSTLRPDPNTWRRGSVIKWQSEDGLARGKLAESQGTADVKTDNARVRSKDYIAGGSKEWTSRDGLSRGKVTAYQGQTQYTAVSTETKHQEYDPGSALSSFDETAVDTELADAPSTTKRAPTSTRAPSKRRGSKTSTRAPGKRRGASASIVNKATKPKAAPKRNQELSDEEIRKAFDFQYLLKVAARLDDFIAGKVDDLGTVGTDFNPDKIFPESGVKFAPNLDLGLDQPSFTSSNTFNNERPNFDSSRTNSQPQNSFPVNSQPYNGSPANSNPYNGSPSNSQPYSGSSVNPQTYNGSPANSRPYESSPVDSQPYNGSPANSRPYNGSPANSQSYNGSPASSQPYGSPAISDTYKGASATNARPYNGSPASSQLYNGSPIYPQQ